MKLCAFTSMRAPVHVFICVCIYISLYICFSTNDWIILPTFCILPLEHFLRKLMTAYLELDELLGRHTTALPQELYKKWIGLESGIVCLASPSSFVKWKGNLHSSFFSCRLIFLCSQPAYKSRSQVSPTSCHLPCGCSPFLAEPGLSCPAGHLLGTAVCQVVPEKEQSDKYSLCVETAIRLNAACLLSWNVCLSVFAQILPESASPQSLTSAALCGVDGGGCMLPVLCRLAAPPWVWDTVVGERCACRTSWPRGVCQHFPHLQQEDVMPQTEVCTGFGGNHYLS